jgi:O-antigen ligase
MRKGETFLVVESRATNLSNTLALSIILVISSVIVEIYFASTLITLAFIATLLLSGAVIMTLSTDGYYKIIICCTVLIISAPYISVPLLQFAVRPEQIVLLGAIIADFVQHFNAYTDKNVMKSILKKYWIFFLLMASTVFSTLYGVLVLKYLPSVGDIMEVIKIIVYFLLFYLASKISSRKQIIGIIKTMAVCGVIVSVYSVMQYFNIFNINVWLSSIYGPSNHYSVLFKDYVRAYSTFGNPNYFGFYMSLNIMLAAIALLFYTKNWKQTLFYFVLYYVYSYGLLTTASRTALISTIVGVGYLFIAYIHAKKPFVWFEFAKKCAIFIILALLLYTTMPQTMSFRIDATVTPSSDISNGFLEHISGINSISTRFERWQYAWDIIKGSPIIGIGPMESRIYSYIDNEYLLLWAKYGIVGLIIYVALYVYLFILGSKWYRREKETVKFYGLWLETIIIVTLINNCMAVTFYHMQLMSLIIIIGGLVSSFFLQKTTKFQQGVE